MATDLTVANTIAAQIGRQAFIMMGTRFKVGDDNSLRFDVRGSRKVTHVKVTLNAQDTYDIAFLKVRGTKVTEVSTSEGVYNDMLQDVIENHTGLFLSLHARR